MKFYLVFITLLLTALLSVKVLAEETETSVLPTDAQDALKASHHMEGLEPSSGARYANATPRQKAIARRLSNMTPEEREAARERFKNASPEQRQEWQEKLQESRLPNQVNLI